jgi:RluA family pseudouridine synthase
VGEAELFSPQFSMQPLIKLSSPNTKEFWKIPVLFEDDALLAIDKPSGLLISPDRYDPERANLMKLLHRDIARGAAWAIERKITYLANAHRLDFGTSGVVLLAKTKPALIELANQFSIEKTGKIYLTLVQGSPELDEFEVDASLAPHPTRPQFIRVDEKNGKRSRTAFRALERFKGYTLLQCMPFTGRTHQIRVHLMSKHLPVVADESYGGRPLMLSSLKKNYRLKPGREELPLIGRLALHASQLTVIHPVTRDSVTIDAPLPKDFSVALKFLRRFASSTR